MTTATNKVTCPSCSTGYRIPADFRGSSVKCKKCAAVIRVGATRKPTPPASPAAAAVRGRSTRPARAVGDRPRQPLSPVHMATAAVTLAVVVIGIVIAISR